MPDKTLTIELEGDVSLADFVDTLRHFNQLVVEISHAVAGDADIEWLIDDLQAGSAMATIAGIYPEDEPVLDVIRAYENVGHALQYYEPVPYSPGVAREAGYITQKISDKITAIRFQTARTEYVMYGAFDTQIKPTAKPRVSFGTVKGRVQTISSRGRYKFTLYDNLFDKSVTCYVQDGQEETMKDIWGKVVAVTGYVTRDSETGRAKTIRDITAIDPVHIVEPGSYKKARGILSWMGDEPAEVAIRRLRDAEG